ncbi:MAG: hypothetical protein EOM83_02170 [Clostridia bacterium]|nr:hypothetical protein [Clostridia bacterium]
MTLKICKKRWEGKFQIPNSKFQISDTGFQAHNADAKETTSFNSAYFESNFETTLPDCFILKYQPYFLP